MNVETGVVNIRGRNYHTVAKRVDDFRQAHPEHGLTTEIIVRDADCVVVRATISDPAGRVIATGHSEEYRKASQINRTSALENCETSAIGRALASFGIGGTEFASANEVENAIHQQREGQGQEGAVSPPAFPEGPAKNITALKAWRNEIWRAIEGAGDSEELEALIDKDRQYFVQASILPEGSKWRIDVWEGDGEDNIGLRGFVNLKRQEFELQEKEPA